MELFDVLTLNLNENKNDKILMKKFKTTKVYDKLKDKEDAAEMIELSKKYLKQKGYDTILLLDYSKGVVIKMIDYNNKMIIDVRGNSVSECYIKMVVFVSLKMRKGAKK